MCRETVSHPEKWYRRQFSREAVGWGHVEEFFGAATVRNYNSHVVSRYLSWEGVGIFCLLYNSMVINARLKAQHGQHNLKKQQAVQSAEELALFHVYALLRGPKTTLTMYIQSKL